jgi:hypothetical protein
MTQPETRVYTALDDREWIGQGDVIKLAKQAPARTLDALRWLIAEGRVEWSKVKVYRDGKPHQGRPRFLYRRRATR